MIFFKMTRPIHTHIDRFSLPTCTPIFETRSINKKLVALAHLGERQTEAISASCNLWFTE
jgi:hypothetical protein